MTLIFSIWFAELNIPLAFHTQSKSLPHKILPGFRWAKGNSPDSNSQRQRAKLNMSALMLYLVHWVNTSGAIHRRFYTNKNYSCYFVVVEHVFKYSCTLTICIKCCRIKIAKSAHFVRFRLKWKWQDKIIIINVYTTKKQSLLDMLVFCRIG